MTAAKLEKNQFIELSNNILSDNKQLIPKGSIVKLALYKVEKDGSLFVKINSPDGETATLNYDNEKEFKHKYV